MIGDILGRVDAFALGGLLGAAIGCTPGHHA
jgi:hypothetical protein